MAPQELERIFEPFSRGSSPATAAVPGAGLGLTMAKMLTDLMGGEMKVESRRGEGSLFTVRLFLPRVHEPVAPATRRQPAAPRARSGYDGPRRSILVVDNEEPDRELLRQLLTPLGLELRSAASGHDALDLIAAGWRPDAMFVDLAMPGIDGWETVRRVHALQAGRGHALTAAAIVSANAFDKRLENDVGITPEDFFVKPVRHSELLDWLERRLGLQWTEHPAPPAAAPAAAALVRPSGPRLHALEQAIGLGYFRGIMKQLDEIDAAEPECAAWTASQRAFARQFQFEAMSRSLLAEDAK
jgi:CheY-like chemotaxis protein